MVIAEQAAQSLTTSHLPVRTADAFFRFEQRVPEPLMVALSVIMMDELSDGTAQRLLTEEDHPLQALALDRQNKPFDISVQIRCLVPADGWFEWQRTDDGGLSMVNVGKLWRGRRRDDGEGFEGVVALATVLPQSGKRKRRPVLKRQKVGLLAVPGPDRFDEWLDPTSPVPRLLDLVREPYCGPYEKRAVSTRVNSVRNDDPDILTPRSEMELF